MSRNNPKPEVKKPNKQSGKQLFTVAGLVAVMILTYFVYQGVTKFDSTNWDDKAYIKEAPLVRDINFEKVKEIIVDSLSCDESQVTMEANLKDDLEADSLDAVELIMQIEEEFEVEIPDEVASNMKTVKDIVDYIEANK